ncbi:YheC/YheD family protein [Alteribacter keqinensis]|uniref:ATP-grasp domain-containing protein n=1 Tax=Alteribacter keqinensis TaxID=2483800 RepID=A0A3M7TN41_9BACI|nr:YheC/YheD family protein [Alteribacter keqinensis]RNA66808.1 hypothetical protein EBO34_16510 [Alteribacter keqinensis]
MYIIWDSTLRNNCVLLARENYEQMTFTGSEVALHIGAFSIIVAVEPTDAVKKNHVVLSASLLPGGGIPDTFSYEVKLAGEDFHIGPVTGVLVSERRIAMHTKRGFESVWKEPVQSYMREGGLVFLFCENAIDFNNKTISGLYYDKREDVWKEAVFPIPSVVYRRTGAAKKTLRKLRKSFNVMIFNSKRMNKWKLYKKLVSAGYAHTPDTMFFSTQEKVTEMLNKYQSVYLKPINGNLGKGCFKLDKTSAGYVLSESKGIKHECEEIGEVLAIFNEKKMKRRYLIQQSVPLMYEGKPVDYRVIIQKGRNRNWTETGVVAKVGKRGVIVTNHVSLISSGTEVMKMSLNLSKKEAEALYSRMVERCIEACEAVEDKLGHLGDVGLDVIIDSERNIWILEMNALHNHLILAYQDHDPELQIKVLTKPLEYARSLSGF